MSAIAISPVSVWTPAGTKSATQFAVRYVTYQNGPSVADCQLLDADGAEVGSCTVAATVEQTATWADDADFYAVLAQNAGLTPA
jgi:predicted secreted Zn-dependent protease